MKSNLIGVMVFKIHIWIMIWNSWKFSHVLQPSWLLLKFHAFMVEEEWTEGERDFLYIQIIHFKYMQYVFHFPFCKIYFFSFFFSSLILLRRNIKWLSLGPLTLTNWLSRSLLSTLCFYYYQRQILEFNGNRKVRIAKTGDNRGCQSKI